MVSLLKDVVSLVCYTASSLFKNKSQAVLLYHSIDNFNNKDDLYRLNLKPDLFEKQIKFLYSYNKQDMLLTFDDGFSNFFYNAFPLLLRYNMKSILFITTDFIDRKFSFDRLFKNKFSLKPLNWEQIKEIADAGIEIGSHTLSHPKLTRLDNKTAYREIMDSKNKIEDIVCKKVISFAYSYGWRDSFDSRIKEIVKDCGYQRAYANIMGFNYANSDLYELRRIRIDSNDNMFRFKMKIKGAYNYIDSLKYCLNFKNVKE